MTASEKIFFDHATVRQLSWRGADIVLEVICVGADESDIPVVVWFRNVSKVVVDGIADEVKMEMNDGEILFLNQSAPPFLLVIQWNDFIKRDSIVSSYRIICDRLEISVSPLPR